MTLGLLTVAAHPVQAADPDRIAALLDQQKIKYEVDKDNDYKIIYDFGEEKRSQIVYVSGSTEEFEGLRIRAVFAPAARLTKDNIEAKFKSLLENNGKSKIGAWEINGDMLFFSAKMFEPVTAEELSAMLHLVSSVADDKEIEISGTRDEL
jgi:hypothetical protein